MKHPTFALSLRDALARVAAEHPSDCRAYPDPIARDAIAADFVRADAGVPATPRSRRERIVTYGAVEHAALPLVLGAYGCVDRIRGWLPGLPRRFDRPTFEAFLAHAKAPVIVDGAGDAVEQACDLEALPIPITTERDAGPYITMGLVCAGTPDGEMAMSVHRMLVLDSRRLTIWMLPNRQLRAMSEAALLRRESLPITINIGAPPAAMIASALATRWLPPACSKLDIAGALAGAPVAIEHRGGGFALAGSEIVLEGSIDGRSVDECRAGGVFGHSMPEFLGYDGRAQHDLPIVEITRATVRPGAVYPSVIGPGREQSNILGLAGALTVGFSLDHPNWPCDRGPEIVDIALPAAGGGMLLLLAQLRLTGPLPDDGLDALALRLFSHHPFVKLIVFVDEDVSLSSEEDVLWAVTTRANLGRDVHSFDGFPRLGMDPSQQTGWRSPEGESAGRSYIDATRPASFRSSAERSFAALLQEVSA
ncbi:UbiD family decarboxylase domain-containing protein [Marinivivus vitaminiproducens]|uniref:UbiD family decarboxylase domain-containing protein n=1 Tax=Marinivivus vitaminiproducens TaxID=3035935 RepID=UPI00279E5569|nr:UbiD family decarboxylase [Geminicoccaceae bacterium SCSIO 64248]